MVENWIVCTVDKQAEMLRSSLLCSVEGVLCERAVCLCFRACDRLSFSSAVSVLECAVWCGRRLYMFSCMQCTWVFVCTHSATHVRVFAQGALAVASAAQHWSPSCHSLYWWTQSVLSDPWAAAALRREQTHPCLGQRCSSGPWSKFSFVERLHFIWLNIQMCYKKWEKKQSVLYVVWCWPLCTSKTVPIINQPDLAASGQYSGSRDVWS